MQTKLLLVQEVEYLINIILQLLGKNRIYAVENPGYHKIAKIMEANGIEPKYIPLNDDGINMNELINSKANVLHITPSHHFPLGIVTPVKKRNEILNWAYNTDSYIIEDDYDSEFRYTGRPIPALQSLDKGSKVIYLNTFAKNIAPSLRISYMVLPENLAEKYQNDLVFIPILYLVLSNTLFLSLWQREILSDTLIKCVLYTSKG